MRYWKPFVNETFKNVLDWGPNEVILLPLYPQFSTTTSGSSLISWRKRNKYQ
jgi:ferrochelatase